MIFVWLILIVPGVICLYALIIRGLLHKVPALKTFYADADTFWAKAWAICGKSVTMAWAHIVGGIGTVLELMDPIASALGDPDLKQQITDTLQMNPQVLGYVLIGISVVTVGARVRTIGRD